jgi:hypothetical protein
LESLQNSLLDSHINGTQLGIQPDWQS